MSGIDPKKEGKVDEKKTAGRRGTGRSRAAGAVAGTPGPTEATGLTEGSVPTQMEQAQPLQAGVRGRSGRAAIEGRGESPGEGSPAEGGSPPDVSPERGGGDAASRKELIALAKRPEYGTHGNKIVVLANHFEISIRDELVVVQYAVDITHTRIKLNRDMKRDCFWQCVTENQQVFGGNIHAITYDGDKLCTALQSLKFPKNTEEPGAYVAEVTVTWPRFDRPEPIRVKMQLVGMVHVRMKDVSTIGGTGNGDRYTTPLAFLDVLFRQQCSCPLTNVASAWYPFGPTLYRVPRDPLDAPGLGWGQCIWQGLFSSARLGQFHAPFMNFDVSHSSFYRPQPVVDFLVEIMNSKFGGGFARNQLNSASQLSPTHVQVLNREMKGLFIATIVRPLNGQEYTREYRVNSVLPTNALENTFERKREDGNAETVTVAQHFRERYGELKYPKLNLLSVGGKKRGASLPMEQCYIVTRQRVNKKFQAGQADEMIKAAAISAPNRRQKIGQLVAAGDFEQDPWLKQFGVRVNTEMKKVDARILPPLKI